MGGTSANSEMHQTGRRHTGDEVTGKNVRLTCQVLAKCRPGKEQAPSKKWEDPPSFLLHYGDVQVELQREMTDFRCVGCSKSVFTVSLVGGDFLNCVLAGRLSDHNEAEGHALD